MTFGIVLISLKYKNGRQFVDNFIIRALQKYLKKKKKHIFHVHPDCEKIAFHALLNAD